jgi:MYXO-CTERM domain-containing protein
VLINASANAALIIDAYSKPSSPATHVVQDKNLAAGLTDLAGSQTLFDPDILGGSRRLTADLTMKSSPTASNPSVKGEAGGGSDQFMWSQIGTGRGIGTIEYDGIDNFDLTGLGAYQGFQFLELSTGGAGYKLTVSVFNELSPPNGWLSTVTLPILPTNPNDPIPNLFIPFSSFTSGADFTSIDKIVVTIDGRDVGNNQSLSFTQFQVNATPEPASLAAWGGMGLFGLVMAARRRKQK